MNKSALNHPTLQARIFAAMQRVRLTTLPRSYYSDQTYVKNSKGENCIRVMYNRGASNPFTFTHKNTIITAQVLQSLKA